VATARRPVASLGSGAQGERRLLSVLLGASSENARATESQKLLNWGYTAFDAVRLVPVGEPVASVRVWKGKAPEVKLGSPDGVVVSVPAGEGSRLKTEIVRPEPLVAPLTKGQSVGVLRVTLASGAPVGEIPLVVLETVEESGMFGRAWDALRLWIQ
jgi:D-alanyl-D-alanine carboxypeptidase (penicillin-binding protein 5/6)